MQECCSRICNTFQTLEMFFLTLSTMAGFKPAPQVARRNLLAYQHSFPTLSWTLWHAHHTGQGGRPAVGIGSHLYAGAVFDALALTCVLLSAGAAAAAWESCCELCGTAPGTSLPPPPRPTRTLWVTLHWGHREKKAAFGGQPQ